MSESSQPGWRGVESFLHRAVSIILDGLDFDLSATHIEGLATLGVYGSDVTEVGNDNRRGSISSGCGLAALAVQASFGSSRN